MSPKGKREQIQTRMMKDEEKKFKTKGQTEETTEMENTKDLKKTFLIV